MKKNNVIGKARLNEKRVLNSFDLSHRNVFSSSLGRMYPIHVMECIPGDNVQISPSWFTRAQTLVSNSYGRFIENVQTFFVPYSSIMKNIQYNLLPTLQHNADGSSVSRVAKNLVLGQSSSTKLPYCKVSDIYAFLLLFETYYYAISNGYSKNKSFFDVQFELPFPIFTDCGMLRSLASNQLLEYLGFPYLSEINVTSNRDLTKTLNLHLEGSNGQDQVVNLHPLKEEIYSPLYIYVKTLMLDDLNVNVLRLCAYHLVYNNYYRNDTWQQYNASNCNLDWVDPTAPYVFNPLQGSLSTVIFNLIDKINSYIETTSSPTMAGLTSTITTNINGMLKNWLLTITFFDLELSNLSLDAVNGVLPNPQYGSSIINGGFAKLSGNHPVKVTLASNTAGIEVKSSEVNEPENGSVTVFNGSNVSTLGTTEFELRRSKALQRFLEISQSHDSSFKEQIKAHFGVEPKDDVSPVYFVGGSSSVMQVDTQVNNNLADENDAVLGGIASATGSYNCRYNSDTYGVLITIYRILPVLDYGSNGLSEQILTVDSSDLPIPEFNDLGYTSRSFLNLNGLDSRDSVANQRSTYGYAARYFDYKTARDVYHGSIRLDEMKDKVMSTTPFVNGVTKDNFDMTRLLLATPSMADSIFKDNEHGYISNDQFYTNTNLSVPAVRPFSVTSLPFAH